MFGRHGRDTGQVGAGMNAISTKISASRWHALISSWGHPFISDLGIESEEAERANFQDSRGAICCDFSWMGERSERYCAERLELIPFDMCYLRTAEWSMSERALGGSASRASPRWSISVRNVHRISQKCSQYNVFVTKPKTLVTIKLSRRFRCSILLSSPIITKESFFLFRTGQNCDYRDIWLWRSWSLIEMVLKIVVSNSSKNVPSGNWEMLSKYWFEFFLIVTLIFTSVWGRWTILHDCSEFTISNRKVPSQVRESVLSWWWINRVSKKILAWPFRLSPPSCLTCLRIAHE
jgi:hypothetical protein